MIVMRQPESDRRSVNLYIKEHTSQVVISKSKETINQILNQLFNQTQQRHFSLQSNSKVK